ncbi:MAG: alpha/beta fold hydrolase [Rhizobacter sp.]
MQVQSNGISIEVDVRGAPQGEPLLLIMGLGMQLTGWHDRFVDVLVSRGYRVIRFDNRDAGLSQHFDALGMPNLPLAAARSALGLPLSRPYGLHDMAHDALGVLDALGIRRAHVCGASMGGMIAQHLAARHPDRLASLTLMMTTSGARRVPGPSWRIRAAMLARPPKPDDAEAVIAARGAFFRLIEGPAHRMDDAELRERLELDMARAYRPAGTARQLVAIATDRDRSPLLPTLRLPCHIIHGRADPMIPVQAGLDLHARIAGATLDVIDGMGHDMPTALYGRFADGIAHASGRA